MERAKTYERRIGLLLRFGVLSSSVLMAAGLYLATLHPAGPASAKNPTLGELLQSILSGDLAAATGSAGFTLIFLGLLILMFTPFLRVLAALFAFMKEKDWRFVGVAAIVFCILVAQLIYTIH